MKRSPKLSQKLSQKEYARRREQLMDQMEPDSIAIVPSAVEKIRSRDTEFPYRQDSDLQYLCGFAEPESVLVLIPGRAQGEFVMFCRERDPEREIWDGKRLGPQGVCDDLKADDAFPIDDIDDILPGLLEGRARVYYALGQDTLFDARVMSWINTIRSKVRSGAIPPGEFSDLNHLLHDMRLFKSKAEQGLMAKAGDIAAKAHCRAMKNCKPGVFEYQLEAEILHEFASQGARYPAYNTIVGGGANGCILHYVENADVLKDGDLVLIDAGCEYQGYASDITRTFPVNGKFTAAQKALYEVVLAAQQAAMDVVKPGEHWNAPHDASVQAITEGLVELGLLKGKVSTLIKKGAYKAFYMHRIGHWLGMDVHDVGDYKIDGQWRVMEPGMAMTVEPGIYVSPDNKKVAPKWRGIGIRIEDDIVVTRDGYTCLTDGVPKTVESIEKLMQGRKRKAKAA